MKTKLRFLCFGILLSSILFSENVALAAEKTRMVATTSTLASMVRELAGDWADIHYIASPSQNIHFIQPTPKDVLKVKKANVFVHQGLDLEAWRDPLLVASGNSLFLSQGSHSIDASKGVPLIEIPASLSRVQGDIHAYGNPHYAIDPENAKIMMGTIADGLSRIFPESASEFAKKSELWISRLDQKIKDWNARMAPFRGFPIVTYHRSWPYFANRFGLVIVGELEPKPGIPPTPQHLSELMKTMKEKNVKLVIKEVFNESSSAEKVAKVTGARVVTLNQDVDEDKETADYIAMIEHNIQLIEKALKT